MFIDSIGSIYISVMSNNNSIEIHGNETLRKPSTQLDELQNVEDGLRSNDNTMKTERSQSLVDPSQFDQSSPMRKRLASIVSVSDLGGEIVATRKLSGSSRKGIWGNIVDFLDLTLLKDLIYVNIAFGVACGLFSDNMFTSLLPLYLNSLGFHMNDAAIIVSTGTAFDLLSRVIVAILSLFFAFKARMFFLVGLSALVCGRIVFLFVSSFHGMLVIMAFIGFIRTSLHIPMSLIFAEYLPSER